MKIRKGTTLESLIQTIEYPLSVEQKSIIQKAYQFAKEKHEGQERKSGEPYFIHVLAVAKNTAALGMDLETIVGALLHDTLEDTETTEEEIQNLFGEKILFLVKGVTKLGKVKYRGQERHVESMRKFFIALAEDLRVLIIKLADRLHNIQTLEHVRPDKRTRIALETIEVHAALAGRLGMGKLKGLLEDYAFPYAYPKEYEKTKALLDDHMPRAKQTVEKVHKKLTSTLKDFDIKNPFIESRAKHTYSLYKKLLRYDMDIERIYDIVALRVVVDDIANCYQVLGLIHMIWKPIPGRIKDYIALPKPNGYQSLHTTVVTEFGIVEIQIRTDQMHQESEMGIASHFLYKEQKNKNVYLPDKKVNWLNDLKDLQNAFKNPSHFLKQLTLDLFNDRIFVFTPKGDVIDLPIDASPIDFAYTVHSEIGDTISSAKVNGKMAALSTKLKNGDIVDIVTQKNAKPSAKWMDYAKTSFARKRIRNYVTEHGGIIQRFFLKE